MNAREELLRFGSDDGLVGIVTHPPRGQDGAAGAILLNAGLVHRVGPARQYVELARTLAAQGWTCLRFDHAGIGDSAPPSDRLPAEKAAVFQAIEAMDALQRHAGVRQFALIGMCAGTPTAFQAAGVDPRVVAVVLLNAVLGDRETVDEQQLQEMTARKVAHSYLGDKLFRPSAWLRVLRGQTSLKKILATLLRARRSRARREAVPPDAASAAVLAALGALTTRGTRVLVLFGERTGVRQYFAMKYQAHLATLPCAERLRFSVVPNGDHSFTSLALQREVRERVSAWLGAAPRPDPAAVAPSAGAASHGAGRVPRRRPAAG